MEYPALVTVTGSGPDCGGMTSQTRCTVIAPVARRYSSPMIQMVSLAMLARMVAVMVDHLCIRRLSSKCAEAEGDNQGSRCHGFVNSVHCFLPKTVAALSQREPRLGISKTISAAAVKV